MDFWLLSLLTTVLQHLDCWLGVFVTEIFCCFFLLHSDIWCKPELLWWILLQGGYKLFHVWVTPNFFFKSWFLIIANVTFELFLCLKITMWKLNWSNNLTRSKSMFRRCLYTVHTHVCILTKLKIQAFFSSWNVGRKYILLRISSKRTFGTWLGDSPVLTEKWICFCRKCVCAWL
jgi:hypothetical protein